jgi:hypothetical protein
MKRIVLDNDYHSDFENENSIDDQNLDVEDFYFYYSNDILDIYEEIKERLSHSPFFFSNLKYPLLTEFIISFVLYNGNDTTTMCSQGTLNLFNDYYSVEIESSYNIIYKFLRKFKRNLQYNKWQEFCFKFSDLHELKSNYFI